MRADFADDYGVADDFVFGKEEDNAFVEIDVNRKKKIVWTKLKRVERRLLRERLPVSLLLSSLRMWLSV